MGKPTGFIEYLRELPLDRSAIERIADWNEFHHHMVWHPILSHWHVAQRNGLGLSGA